MFFGLRESGRGSYGRLKATSRRKCSASPRAMDGIGCGISGVGIAGLKFSANAVQKTSRSSTGRSSEELVEKQEFVGAYYEADGDDLVSA